MDFDFAESPSTRSIPIALYISDPTRTKSCLRASRGYLGGQIERRPPHTLPRIESIPQSRFRFLGYQYCSNVWLFILCANLLDSLVNNLSIHCSVKDLNPVYRFGWVRLIILDQSLLQPLKHLGRVICESVKPTQSDKHENAPFLDWRACGATAA